jgi:hypothetical protein
VSGVDDDDDNDDNAVSTLACEQTLSCCTITKKKWFQHFSLSLPPHFLPSKLPFLTIFVKRDQ